MVRYSEEEMLLLSGIQHFVFCPRQWALIYMDQLWAENLLTSEGKLLHKNVDNPFLRETNSTDFLTLRGIRLESDMLGLYGVADAVEIRPSDGAPASKSDLLESRLFEAIPVEYKRGRRKINDCDRVQVAAQAIMLEPVLNVEINKGAVFYWEERHREYFNISQDMRIKVERISVEMHEIYAAKQLPKAMKKPHCRSCSLVNECMPGLNARSASKYIENILAE